MIKLFISTIALILVSLLATAVFSTAKQPPNTTFSMDPSELTISEYKAAPIRDGLEFSWKTETYKFVKRKNIYGVLKLESEKWNRVGRWYFFSEGKLHKSTAFSSDKKHGYEYFYNKYGFLKRQHHFDDGLRQGKSARYSSKGALSSIQCYVQDEEFECPEEPHCTSYKRQKKQIIIENQ